MVSGIYAWRSVMQQPADYTQPDPRALADRARRQATPESRDLTGILLGDPPAGRSALDRKREVENRINHQLEEHTDGE
jgi:hypothetical protein